MIASIIVDVAHRQVNRSFDYLVPEKLEGVIEIGHRVKVPFGHQDLLGFVVDLKTDTDYDSGQLKYIKNLLEASPSLNKEFVDLAYYMADEYYCFYIETLKTMIPTALGAKYSKFIVLKDSNNLSEEVINLFKNTDKILFDTIPEVYLRDIKAGIKQGSLTLFTEIKNKMKAKTKALISVLDSTIPFKSKNGVDILAYLEEVREAVSEKTLINDLGFSKYTINSLVKKGVLNKSIVNDFREINSFTKVVKKDITLNEAQQIAYDEIIDNKPNTYLLHGVTGSGKTEVYLNLIEYYVNKGNEAIMLVPEISLTPQMVSRLIGKFGDLVAVLHSGLSTGEKYDEWRKIYQNKVKIVVGARSAIFAPFNNLGIIIIDESHDTSYVQSNSPRYDTIDVASVRAKTHSCSLVLGTATPRVERYYKALRGDIKLLELKERANKFVLPNAKIVDMKTELISGNRSVFSEELKLLIRDRLSKHEQMILFLNKRGHSTFVQCRECGEAITCPNCDTTLTYHQNKNQLVCHYCGFSKPNVHTCPNCGSTKIKFVGTGTEKIVDEIEKIWPEAKVIRIDSDNTTKKNSTEKFLESFRNHEADILVGTQIIAKGLDYPLVTLVGVLNADLTMKLPFYDAYERTYELLEQVSGRTGRGVLGGEILIQTYNPSHYTIKYASTHNYLGFYKEEIINREITSNPPFKENVEIMCIGQDPSTLYKKALEVIKYIKNNSGSRVLGPTKDFIFRINNQYRFKISIKFSENDLKPILNYLNLHYQNNKEIKLQIKRS